MACLLDQLRTPIRYWAETSTDEPEALHFSPFRDEAEIIAQSHARANAVNTLVLRDGKDEPMLRVVTEYDAQGKEVYRDEG